MAYQVKIIQGNKTDEFEVEKGKNLYDIINQKGYQLTAYCGGEGTCQKCRVRLTPAPELKSIEEEIFTDKEKAKGAQAGLFTSG